MSPRMTNAELIAAEEAKLAEIRAKAEAKIAEQEAKSQARLAELKAKADERTSARKSTLDERIVGAKERLAKAQAYLDKLILERDELDEDDGQPVLPVEDDEQATPIKRGKRDAA